MASNKLYVDLNLNSNELVNLKVDTLDITTNSASTNAKRIVYYDGQYYYSNGTSWIALGGGSGNLPTGGATGDILAKASGTNYDVQWIPNYTSTVQHEVKAGVALTKGQAVYVSSANGTNIIVSKASNVSESTSSKTMGLAASSAALNGIIFVITEGLLTGTGGAPLNTGSATAGDPVWLGTNGNLLFGLANKPVAPAHLVFIGIVTRSSATVGEIFVKVQNGFELGELHDVDALNASNNDGLFYNTSNSLWEHKSIGTALGYTPENVANKSTSTSLGTSNTLYPTQNAVKVYADNLLGNANALVYKGTIDCSINPNYPAADAGYMYIVSVAGKIGGTSGTDVEVGDMIICNTDGTVSGNQATVGQYWNVIQKNIVGAVTGPASSVSNNVVFFDGTTGKIIKDSGLTLSGSNTGDETTATIKTKLGIASASADGYLTSTNWTTFNNKQDALGFTPANISGDTFTGDIYAQNLSGNNTGDETLGSIKSKLGQSSSTLDGWLSSVDWDTFNYKISSNGIWRGVTFRNNSTTIDTTGGITLATSGTNVARAVSSTSFKTKNIRLGVTASIVSTGRYCGMRGSALLWYLTGGFLFVGEFNISDQATATGTHNFWGLASSTSDLVIGDVGNSQPSALTNIIAFANDSGDTNLQIMYNNASGIATKIDLGSSFPSNRTAGADVTTIYSCYLYNTPNSSQVNYRIVNKENGAIAQGTLSTNLPASTVGLNFFGARTMGTSGGGVTNSGQFDVYRLGVYSL